jgi:hypothetical protein
VLVIIPLWLLPLTYIAASVLRRELFIWFVDCRLRDPGIWVDWRYIAELWSARPSKPQAVSTSPFSSSLSTEQLDPPALSHIFKPITGGAALNVALALDALSKSDKSSRKRLVAQAFPRTCPSNCNSTGCNIVLALGNDGSSMENRKPSDTKQVEVGHENRPTRRSPTGTQARSWFY